MVYRLFPWSFGELLNSILQLEKGSQPFNQGLNNTSTFAIIFECSVICKQVKEWKEEPRIQITLHKGQYLQYRNVV